MSDEEGAVFVYRTGDIMMWRVEADQLGDALGPALHMGWVANQHRLGSWGVAQIGVGGAYWFDLTMETDRDEIWIRLAFGRLPDLIY